MKTILIFDSVGEGPIQFLVVEGDHTHLHNLYINAFDNDEKKENELMHLIWEYNEKDEYVRPKPMQKDFPVDVFREGDAVIICGFLP